MEIAKIKLIQLCQHGDLMERYGVSLRILGERDLVRPDVLEVIDEAVETTKHNERYACSFPFLLPWGSGY
jgi:undecaprenyl pyrophosphate synthase